MRSLSLILLVFLVSYSSGLPKEWKSESEDDEVHRGACGGCPSDATNNPNIDKLLKSTLIELNSKSNHSNKYKLIPINATSQVVAGSLYKIKALLVLTDCSKNETKDVELCTELDEPKKEECEISIWDRPWLPNGRKTDAKQNMEDKLRQYREQKQREELLTNPKPKVFGLFQRKNIEKPSDNMAIKKEEEKLIKNEENGYRSDLTDDFDDDDSINCSRANIIFYVLCFVLWATLYAIFIELEFGIIYFIISGFVGMYLNTRTGKKKEGEVSAYSVFNQNCEAIDGTLKAEHLERQMIYGQLL